MTTWMVVEDEPDLYEMLLAMSEMFGIDGQAFVDGEEAIAWIDDVDRGYFQGELPELALLDIRLPSEISGVGIGARLRTSPYLRDTVIVLMTAYKLTVDQEKKMLEQSGADLLVYKPLPKFSEFYEKLQALIKQR